MKRKTTKMRGSKTHGYGSKKKHRGAGSRGGRGMAGSKKHRKTWILKYKPNHIGKKGFKSLSQRKITKPISQINLRDIQKLTNEKSIVLSKFGYDKVLGAGAIEKPLIIKAKSFSKKAKEKILKAKGKPIYENEKPKEYTENKEVPKMQNS